MGDNLSPYGAEEYEEGIRKTMPFYETFYLEAINLVKCFKPKPAVWLDTGCGTGSLIFRAHPIFPNTKFLLSDPSFEMLQIAKENLKTIQGNKIQIIGNIGTEQLPDALPEKPEVITAILAHHYFSKKERAIATKKCYELLNDDGIYITFENIYPLTQEGKNIGLERWKNFQLSQGKSEAAASNHIARYGKLFFPITIEEHLNILRNAGFRVVELLWFSNMQAGLYAIK